MKIEYISKTGSTRLILIFAGWGMDCNPFRNLRHAGYDIAMAYDYRTLTPTGEVNLSDYREICVAAWSFGVVSAEIFLKENPQLPITACVAINGTLYPVDDDKGIPKSIFEATLQNLSPQSLKRFNRRMCGSASAAGEFESVAPQRDFSELADELRAIADRGSASDSSRWNLAYVSNKDNIIPTANQLRAWEGTTELKEIAGPHMPNFSNILANCFINKRLVAQRFKKANHTYNLSACVQADIALLLVEAIRLRLTDRQIDHVLEIGAGTGLLTIPLTEQIEIKSLELWDIATINSSLPGTHRICDAELAIRQEPSERYDLIVSASTLQWFNSQTDFIRQAHRTLKNEGLLAFSTFAPGNFSEISQFLPASLHYSSAARLTAILEKSGFCEISIAEQKKTLNFESPIELLRHIRQTGVNALPPSTLAAKRIIAANIKSLTYKPLIITAKKLHI